MRRLAVLGLSLIGLLLTTGVEAVEKQIPIPRESKGASIDPYWDGSEPLSLTKAAANTTWVKVRDDSACSFTNNNTFGGRGVTAPSWAVWCFDGGALDSCSNTTAYGGGGLPGCWKHYDAHTQGGSNRWHVDTYDTYLPGSQDSSMWCGERGDPDTWVHPPGYGPNYFWSMVVELGTQAQFNTANGCTIGGVHLYSVELAYDYCFVQMSASGTVDTAQWSEVARFNGISNPDSVNCRGFGQSYWGTTGSGGIGNGLRPYQCADWTAFNIVVPTAKLATLGQDASEKLFIRWLLTSDSGWDDFDGSGGSTSDTRGGWRVDEIKVRGSGATNAYFPPDPARADVVNFENNGCGGGNPLCEPGRDKISSPLLPKAFYGGYWSPGSFVRGKPAIVDLWHLTNTPTYPNQAKTCETSNRWVWAGNLTPGGADGNVEANDFHMRLISPVLGVGPGNPYTGSRVTGNIIFYDDYLCMKQISKDVTDTQIRRYDNGKWRDWEGDGFVILGGCEFWNISDFDDWSGKMSATTDSVQYGFEWFDQCDYNAATAQGCMPGITVALPHRKNTFIIDNVSIGFFAQTATQWVADVQDLFQDTFARDVYVHPTTKENWELFPGDVIQDEDSLSVTVTDINGIQANSVVLHYRVSTNCGSASPSTWSHEASRVQGSKAKPAGEWYTKTMNFSFPQFPSNPPPGRENDGVYRTTLQLTGTDFPGGQLSGGLLQEGTVIEYYFTARDNGAIPDTFPDRNSIRRNFIHPLYGTERQDPWPLEVSVLPCNPAAAYTAQGGHRIILENDWYLRNAYDAESDPTLGGAGTAVFPRTSQLYEEAMRDLNIKYDRYDNNASQISRGSNIPFYSEATDADGYGGIRNPGAANHRYESVVWATGRHNQYTVTDSSQIEVGNYLLSGINEGNVWLSGENICEDEKMAGIAEAFAGGNFYVNFVGAVLQTGGCPDNDGLAARKFYIEGVNNATYTPFTAYGGWTDCPLRGQPDALFEVNTAGAGTETVVFQFDNVAHTLNETGGIRNARGTNLMVTTMWDLGTVTTRAARACLTRAILSDFGATMPAGGKYGATNCDATGNPVDVPNAGSVRRFALDQNYPNPFNPSTKIRFSLPKDNMKVELTIIDVSGRQVRTLVNRLQSGAEHEVFWDGRNDAGQDVASGVYFYRLTADDLSSTKKMVLLK